MFKYTKVFNLFLTLRNNISAVLTFVKPIADVIKARLKKAPTLFKNKISPISPPRLRPVQIVEYLSFDDIAFARNYSVVQVRDVLKNELKNVYDVELLYMFNRVEPFNGSTYLLEYEAI